MEPNSLNHITVIIFLVITLFSAAYSAPCGTYIATDGTEYNLSGLTRAQNAGYSVTSGAYIYYFNLCDDYWTPLTSTYCYAPAPAYQMSTTNLCYLLGALPPVIKDGINGPDTGVTIIYTNENDRCQFGTLPRVVNINVKCDQKSKTENVISLTEPAVCVYDIAMTSPNACPKVSPKKGGGMAITGGELFLILFFVVIVLYLVGGAVFRYKFQEVEPGINLIPNLGFWTSIPGLVKDGCVFSYTKVRGLISGN